VNSKLSFSLNALQSSVPCILYKCYLFNTFSSNMYTITEQKTRARVFSVFNIIYIAGNQSMKTGTHNEVIIKHDGHIRFISTVNSIILWCLYIIYDIRSYTLYTVHCTNRIGSSRVYIYGLSLYYCGLKRFHHFENKCYIILQ